MKISRFAYLIALLALLTNCTLLSVEEIAYDGLRASETAVKPEVNVEPDTADESVLEESKFSKDSGGETASHKNVLVELLRYEWNLENEYTAVTSTGGELRYTFDGLEHYYLYDDFDNDGVYELFALVENLGNEFWYINDKGATLLHSNGNSIGEYMLEVLEVGGYRFASFLQVEGDGYTVFLYQVTGGIPYEASISRQGGHQSGHLNVNAFGEVELVQSEYDAYDNGGSGRTYKPYFFYVDEGDFREYGAVSITEEQLEDITGGQLLLSEHIPERGIIGTIYYRENGVVHVNYQIPGGFAENRHLTARFSDGKLLCHSDNYGIYDAVLLAEIATYPRDVI